MIFDIFDNCLKFIIQIFRLRILVESSIGNYQNIFIDQLVIKGHVVCCHNYFGSYELNNKQKRLVIL